MLDWTKFSANLIQESLKVADQLIPAGSSYFNIPDVLPLRQSANPYLKRKHNIVALYILFRFVADEFVGRTVEVVINEKGKKVFIKEPFCLWYNASDLKEVKNQDNLSFFLDIASVVQSMQSLTEMSREIAYPIIYINLRMQLITRANPTIKNMLYLRLLDEVVEDIYEMHDLIWTEINTIRDTIDILPIDDEGEADELYPLKRLLDNIP